MIAGVTSTRANKPQSPCSVLPTITGASSAMMAMTAATRPAPGEGAGAPLGGGGGVSQGRRHPGTWGPFGAWPTPNLTLWFFLRAGEAPPFAPGVAQKAGAPPAAGGKKANPFLRLNPLDYP